MAKKPKPNQDPGEVPKHVQEGHQAELIGQANELKAAQRVRAEELRLEMMRSVITEPLLSKVAQARTEGRGGDRFDVIISLNEFYWGGIDAALAAVEEQAKKWQVKYATASHYCFACLTADQILELATLTLEQQTERRNGNVIYRIWEDSDISGTLTQSLTTVKADAAQRAFHAHGDGIVWAVLDSGIQGDHVHFHSNESPFGQIRSLAVEAPITHVDFTPDGRAPEGTAPTGESALVDRLGHGTHVAGIIAGFWKSKDPAGDPVAATEVFNPAAVNKPLVQREKVRQISGVAPRCKLISMKVIADVNLSDGDRKQTAGQGKVSWVLLAIEQIQRWNQFGKRILVHGVNMSLGYDFDPRWFGCGQSPICVEVNRLVKTGVVVVVSAGNSGLSSFINQSGRAESRYSDVSITDPGNAELAITVGSTHKQMPHLYGVSYFSSRGPTGDGRLKPDLLAPGERIISCTAGAEAQKYTEPNAPQVLYSEQSGTSMAAPHVSGAIAAFLSVRPEFVGQPERVKEILMQTTIDLRRERSFQGAGLIDLMKALQAV